ncbi:MAG: PQQ-like beta-propeller repeat protein [Planctomycetes bacterium]|nr:PQQ-like beta-propeller repeat protein [Planctomycetota bacterium]
MKTFGLGMLAIIVLCGLTTVGTEALGADGADWPCFRGPDHNGISTDSNWNPAALAGGPKVLWTTNAGVGYSSVAVVGNRLYTMGNENNQDFVGCINIDNGKVIWNHKYPCNKGSYPGSRVTPTVDGGRVYSLSRQGHLFCLDAAKGSVIWKKNIATEMKAGVPGWGFSGSPRVDGDTLIINAGIRGIALDKNTGKVLWSTAPGKGGYATPVIFEVGGTRCAAIFGQKALYAVNVENGDELWSYKWETSYDVNASDPIVSGNRVFISSGYDKGCALLDFGSGQAKLVWQNKNMRNHFSSCVAIGGHIYGIDGNAGKGTLTCLEGNTGKKRWSQKTGFGSLMAAVDKLIILNERGDLIIAEASPASYKEISRCKALTPKSSARCWTAPVLCNGRIYCRSNQGQLVCIDVRK